MPIVKTQGGKVVTKDGKVSCECCVSCEQQALTSDWRQFELTQAEYFALYAGGIFERTAELSGDFERPEEALRGAPCSIQAGGSGTITAQYVRRPQLCATQSVFDEFPFNTTSSQNVTANTTCPTPSPGQIFDGITPETYILSDAVFSSNTRIVFRIFDNGDSYKYGAQIRLFQGSHGLTASWENDLFETNLGAQLRRFFSTVPPVGSAPQPDNAFLNFIILGRTIPIPHRLSEVLATAFRGLNPEDGFISENLDVLSHTLEFIPSAP
jgi:hypothetical protein